MGRQKIGFCGGREVKCTDVTLSCEGMKMLVRISDCNYAKIEGPLMSFPNKAKNYPINTTMVLYRNGHKGQMDTEVMAQWLSDRRCV